MSMSSHHLRLYGKTTRAIVTRLPWESGTVPDIPEGEQLCVVPASNMPPGHDIKWWVMPTGLGKDWDRYATTYGVGLGAKDITIHGDRPLLFPEVTRFTGLFQRWAGKNCKEQFRYHRWSPVAGAFAPESERVVVHIGPHISVSGSLGSTWGQVEANAMVIDGIRDTMLPLSSRERIFFEMIFRSPGPLEDETEQILVCAKYSTIIGSRWLAIITPDSIPTELLP